MRIFFHSTIFIVLSLCLLPLASHAEQDASKLNFSELFKDLKVASFKSIFGSYTFSHPSTILAAAISDDSKYALTGGARGSLVLWDLKARRQIRVFKGAEAAVTSLSFNTDGQLAASGHRDGTIRIWQVSNGKLLRKINGHVGSVLAVRFSPIKQQLASAGRDDDVHLWDVKSGELQGSFEDHNAAINSLMFSRDGLKVISGDYEGLLFEWNAESKEVVHKYDTRGTVIIDTVFSADEKQVLTSTVNGTIIIFDRGTGDIVRVLNNHQDWVVGMHIASDGRQLLSASREGRIVISQLPANNEMSALSFKDEIRKLLVSKDRSTLVAVVGSRLHLVDGRLFKKARVKGHYSDVNHLALQEELRKLYSVSADGTVREWILDGDGHSTVFASEDLRFTSIAISKYGQYIAVGDQGGNVAMWKGDGAFIDEFNFHYGPVSSLKFTGDSKSLVSGSSDSSFRFFTFDNRNLSYGPKTNPLSRFNSVELSTVTKEFGQQNSAVNSLDFLLFGRRIATVSQDGNVNVWSVPKRVLRKKFNPELGALNSTFAITKDVLLLAGQSGDMVFWNSRSGEIEKRIEGHEDSIAAVDVSLSNSLIASASYDQSVRIWNLEGEQLDQIDFKSLNDFPMSVLLSSESTLYVGTKRGVIFSFSLNTQVPATLR